MGLSYSNVKCRKVCKHLILLKSVDIFCGKFIKEPQYLELTELQERDSEFAVTGIVSLEGNVDKIK